jgi:hypothetical protein
MRVPLNSSSHLGELAAATTGGQETASSCGDCPAPGGGAAGATRERRAVAPGRPGLSAPGAAVAPA